MQRFLSLDVLRAIAVILVLVCHTGFIPGHSPLLDPLVRGGGSGVNIFFVLSGFLVSGLLFQNPDWKRFLIRRAWKIYPSFWLLIAVTVLPQLRTINWHHVASELLFIQNYTTGLWSHTWTLAVEEHCYLAMPFLLTTLRSTGYRLLTFLSLAGMIFCLEMRCLQLPTINMADSFDIHQHLMKTHLQFGAVFLGVALRHWFKNKKVVEFCSRKAVVLIATGAALLLPTFVLSDVGWHIVWLTTLKAIGAACLVAAFVARGVPQNGLTKSLSYIGQHSYSIYLFHPIPLLWHAGTGWTAVVIYLVASLVAGIYAARCIELPMLGLRERMANSRIQELAATR